MIFSFLLTQVLTVLVKYVKVGCSENEFLPPKGVLSTNISLINQTIGSPATEMRSLEMGHFSI